MRTLATYYTGEDAARLRARFEGVRAGYEADEPDGSVPGASRGPQRYAVITESLRGHGYSINWAGTLADVETVSTANLTEGWQPVCYYDLDELAGDEPLPHSVLYQDVEYLVHGREYMPGGVELTGKWVLKRSPNDRRRSSYDWETVDPSECDLMGWTDDRNPKRYLVAGVRTVVVFNTEPAAP